MTDTKKTLAQSANEITSDLIEFETKVQAGFKKLGWTIFADLLIGETFRDNTGAEMVKQDRFTATIKYGKEEFSYDFEATDAVKRI